MNENAQSHKTSYDIEALKTTSLETIAATIAHEIKNPLALIKANIDFIELCDTEKKYCKNYEVMKKEINRANELLVDFNKLLHNGFDMNEVINIRVVIEKVINVYDRYENIKIHLECPDTEEFIIVGNRDLFSMAISNVMKNAVESIADSGSIIVSVKKNRSGIAITIKDNGCGIDADSLAKINGDISVTSKIYGNGLGISLTKKIIAGHGGTFEIRNNDTGGTSVEMVFEDVEAPTRTP